MAYAIEKIKEFESALKEINSDLLAAGGMSKSELSAQELKIKRAFKGLSILYYKMEAEAVAYLRAARISANDRDVSEVRDYVNGILSEKEAKEAVEKIKIVNKDGEKQEAVASTSVIKEAADTVNEIREEAVEEQVKKAVKKAKKAKTEEKED